MILDKVHFYTGQIIDNYIYASQSFYNGLIRVDLTTNLAEFIGTFPDEKAMSPVLHRFSYLYGKKIFFIPCDANNVSVFDEQNGTIELIPISKYCKDNDNKKCFFVNKNKLWLVPVSGIGSIQIINMDNNDVEVCEIEDTPFYSVNIVKICQDDIFVYFTNCGSGTVFRYNIENENVDEFKTAVTNIFNVSYCRNQIWIMKQVNESIGCICNEEEHSYMIHGDSKHNLLVNTVNYKNGVYIIPYLLEPFIKKETSNDYCEELDISSLGINKFYDYPGAFSYDLIETEKKWILPPYNIDKMITIDKETGIIEAKELAFDKPVELSNLSIRNAFMDNMIMEGLPLDLKTFCEII